MTDAHMSYYEIKKDFRVLEKIETKYYNKGIHEADFKLPEFMKQEIR